jgi:hypothetical protein
MIYVTETKRLYTDDGQFIKEMHCPLATKLARTVSAAEPDRSIRCMRCRTEVKNLAYLSDEQALGAAKQNPSVCFFATQAAQNVVHISTPRQGFCFRRQARRDKVQGPLPIPVVRTARALEEMNFAASNGFRLLVQQAGSGRRLRRFVGVYRTTETGALHLCNDYRQAHDIAWVSAQPDPKEVGGEHCEFMIPMSQFIPQGPASPVARLPDTGRPAGQHGGVCRRRHRRRGQGLPARHACAHRVLVRHMDEAGSGVRPRGERDGAGMTCASTGP